MIPSQWFKIANKLAIAANMNEKVSEDVLKDVNKRAMNILVPFFTIFTILTILGGVT